MRRPAAISLATLVIATLVYASPGTALSASADETAQPTSIELTDDAVTFTAGQSVLLTAQTDTDVVDGPIVIHDETTHDIVKTCTTGRTCTAAVSFTSGGPHDYIASVDDLTSTTVTVSRAPWTVQLVAEQTALASGGTTTLTATANQDVADTGGTYAIAIMDWNGDEVVHCCTGDTCVAHSVGAFANGQHVHTYYALVASVSSSGSAGISDVQAQSESVTVTEDSWKLDMTLDKQTVSAGDVVTVHATPTPPAGSAGTDYKTYIFVSETGELLAKCDTSVDCTANYTWRSKNYSFVVFAYVAADGTPDSPSDLDDVQAIDAVSASPNGWHAQLTAGRTELKAGQETTVTATVSQSIDQTDGNLALYIVDAAIDKIVKICRTGSTCSLTSKYYTPDEGVYDTHLYVAIVADDSPDADSMETIQNYRDASDTLRIDWAEWPISLEVTGPNQFTVIANQNLSLTNGRVAIYLLNQETRLVEDSCFSGAECILNASSTSNAGFAALVVKGPRGVTSLQGIDDSGAGIIGGAATPSHGAGGGPWEPGAVQGPVLSGETTGGSNPAERPCQCGRADPVNTATGEYYDSVTDLSLPGVGPALTVARSYSSKSGVDDGPFGPGWAFNWGTDLRVTVPGASPGDSPRQVQVVQENGSTLLFTRAPDGTYQPLSRVFATLLWSSSTQQWTFTRKKTETLVFNVDGQLVRTADRMGNEIDVVRDTGGRISALTGSGGRTLTVHWSGQHITAVTDSAGRQVSYTYNTDNDLVSVTAADGNTTGFGYTNSGLLNTVTKPEGGVTRTTYDGLGRATHQTDPLGHTTTFSYDGYWDTSGTGSTTTTAPDGSAVTDQYVDGLLVAQTADASGDIPRTTTFVYDSFADVTSTTDAIGNSTDNTYDVDGNLISSTDPLGHSRAYTYDNLNDVLSTTDSLLRVTTATYDSSGNQLTATSPSGYTRSWTYNTDGTVASSTDGRGKTTSYGYSAAGLRTSVTDPDQRTRHVSYTAAGFVATQTDAGGHVTTFARDAAGRVLTATSPGLHSTTYTYDGDGNRLTVTSPSGKLSSATFDTADQQTATTDADGVEVTYGYDDVGRLQSSTDADGHATTYAYDAFGEPTTVTDPNGHTATTVYDAGGRPVSVQAPSGATSTTAYDDAGRVSSTTDADGNTTTYTRDANGDVTATTDPLQRVRTQTYTLEGLPETTTLPDGSTVEATYDHDGQETSWTNADGAVTTYSYTDAGLLASKTEPGSKTTNYSYNAAGLLHATTTPGGHTTTLSYDPDGQVTTSHSDVAGSVDITQTYNVDGDRASMTDSTGTSHDGYSDAGRLTSSNNGAGATVGYSYTSTGQLHTINYPGPGRTVTYGYDDAGQMTSLTDWNSHTTGFGWTVDGQLHTQDDPNGDTETNTYDPAGQTTQIQDTTSTDTLATYGYGWDDAGQLTSDHSTDPTGTGVDHTYSYDPTSQLHLVSGSGTSGPVTATPAGQLTGTADGTALTYNTAGELTTTTPTTGPATSYGYDGNGDRTSSTVTAVGSTPAATTGYEYDPAGNLTSVTLPGSTPAVDYDVDGDGRRQARTSGGSTTGFVWDTAGSLPLLLDDGTHAYLYGPGNAPIAQVDDSTGTTEYLHGDLLGSTRLVTDSTGTATGAYRYDAYGTVTAHTGTATTRMQYTGAWTDPDTHLVYLRARDYDPTTSQFMQVDPALDTTHQPYTYTDNNPLSETDPFGLCPPPYCSGYDNFLLSGPALLLGDLFTHGPTGAVTSVFEGIGEGATFGIAGGSRNAVAPQFACYESHDAFAAAGTIAGAIGSLAVGGGEAAAATRSIDFAANAAQDTERIGSVITNAARSRGGVYSLRDEAGVVVRTGRTSDLEARQLGHANDPGTQDYYFRVEYKTDDYAEQRGLEQHLYDNNPQARAENGGLNKIRAVSPRNSNQESYRQAARRYLGE